MRANPAKITLILLLAFLGVGAFCGGAILIISPSGKLFGMPLSMLINSPFENFLIPGVLLFVFLGILPLFLIVPLVKKPGNQLAEKLNLFRDMHWAWTFSIYTAFILIIWLQVEMMFLGSVHWMHTFYMLLAIGIIFVALLPRVRELYKNKIGNP